MQQPQQWYQQESVYPGITRIWEPYVHKFFRGNIWCIEGCDADLVVDFGMGLVPLKPVLGLDPEKPVIALATHAHADHVGAFHEFTERLGHSEEADVFVHMPGEATFAGFFREMEEPVEALPSAGWVAGGYTIFPAPLTRVLEEGDRVELGDFSFETLHLPGHSPGSIGLLDSERKILVSGDAIYSGQLVDDIPGASIPDYLQTMERLSQLDVDMVFGGHNGPVSGDEMRSIAADYLKRKG